MNERDASVPVGEQWPTTAELRRERDGNPAAVFAERDSAETAQPDRFTVGRNGFIRRPGPPCHLCGQDHLAIQF